MVAETQSASAAVVKDTTTRDFRQDVIAESLKRPVLVDFWAPWCGPCRQLAPIIEKVVKAAQGRVALVKLNIDDHPDIPGQLGIQSIPAVIAFQKGQPVDGFVGVLPESQVKSFIERLVGPLDGVDTLLDEADGKAAAGDVAGAAELYASVLAQAPDNTRAIGALVRLHVTLGDLEGARGFLNAVPEDKAADPHIAAARVALDLATQAEGLGDVRELEQRVAADADDHQARFDLALALNGRNRRQDATLHLIEIVRRDRGWNDDGARRQLLQFFEAWGPADPASVLGRRRLSSVLFA
ncbi:MAG: thioredoxin [Pseudochelatococcus sp.]|jgi:putative thioredoxin|uniref:thioredoxin n=1 Tax=Pseudochelatococcus sp. TaxID=2020869 RepID=UPI003D8C9BBB